MSPPNLNILGGDIKVGKGGRAMKCPGQDTQYWTQGAIFEVPCPQCGQGVEFFKDDTTRKCSACGHRFINPRLDFGCASYCKFAEQCIGTLPPELVAQKEDLLKDRVAVAVKRYLKSDFKTIGRAARRARFAEELGRKSDVNLSVVLMAAYLWELDQPGNNGDKASVARSILDGLSAPEPLVAAVCDLLTAPRDLTAADDIEELKVVLQADAMVAGEEDKKKTISAIA
jgi:hypothetical protein